MSTEEQYSHDYALLSNCPYICKTESESFLNMAYVFDLCLQRLLQTFYALLYDIRVTCNTNAETNNPKKKRVHYFSQISTKILN